MLTCIIWPDLLCACAYNSLYVDVDIVFAMKMTNMMNADAAYFT
jgi:hypothetical protein